MTMKSRFEAFLVLAAVLGGIRVGGEDVGVKKGKIDYDRWLEHVHPEVRYKPARIPDGENAYLKWAELDEEEARLPFPWIKELGIFRSDEYKSVSVDAERLKEFKEWLGGKQAVFKRVEAVLPLGKFQAPEWDGTRAGLEACEKRFGNVFGKAWNGTELKLFRARLRGLDGDWEGARQDLLDALRLAEVRMRGDAMMIHSITSMAACRHALTGIQWLADQKEVPEKVLVALLSGLHSFLEGEDPCAYAIRAEFAFCFLPQVVRLEGCRGLEELAAGLTEFCGSGKERANARKAILMLLEGHPRPLDIQATLREASGHYALALQNLEKPWGERKRADAGKIEEIASAWPEGLDSFSGLELDPAKFFGGRLEKYREKLSRIENPAGKHLAAQVFHFPIGGGEPDLSLDRLTRGSFQLRSELEAARALLALRLYERRRGNLPSSLEDLEEMKLLKRAPADPFTRKPLGYSRDRRILWSAGEDGVDNGGSENVDWIWKIPTFSN